MATRSGRPMLGEGDEGYTMRMVHLTQRCVALRNKMEGICEERGATFTSRQRAQHLIAASYWNQFSNERNWDRKQGLLQQAMKAYLELENLLGIAPETP